MQEPSIVLVGAAGSMEARVIAHLPQFVRHVVDLVTFGSARVVRRAVAAATRNGAPVASAQPRTLVWLTVPEQVFIDAEALPGRRARLLHCLGRSGAGHSGTILVHRTSLHERARRVLAGHAGPIN